MLSLRHMLVRGHVQAPLSEKGLELFYVSGRIRILDQLQNLLADAELGLTDGEEIFLAYVPMSNYWRTT